MNIFLLWLLFSCGSERWAAKTLTDADAARIDMALIQSTIHALANLPPHCKVDGASRGVGPEEFQVYQVTGIIDYINLEKDQDVHIALKDPATGETMIVEVVDPDCGKSLLLQQARQQLITLIHGVKPRKKALQSLLGRTVTVTGVGFYDHFHKQRGASKSCLELHPLLSIQ